MNIIVCIKQVIDPDIPARDFKIDETANTVIPPPNIPPVISNFDQYALEAAVQLKEKYGGSIVVLSIGSSNAMDNIKKSLAMGCDEAILLEDDAFEDSDTFGSAEILGAAIRKVDKEREPFDLVLFGRVSSDWSSGATGIAVAESLNLPCISQVQKIETAGDNLHIERVLEDGSATYEISTPCVLTISNEIGEPRLPTVPGILKASRKEVPRWRASDLPLNSNGFGKASSREELLRLYIPKHDGTCEMVGGESVEDAAENLAVLLRDHKLI